MKSRTPYSGQLYDFLHRKVFGIRLSYLLSIFLFYALFAYVYHVTLNINSGQYQDNPNPFFNDRTLVETFISYMVMLVFTLPIWWIIFRWMKDINMVWRFTAHLLLLPIFVYACQQIQYGIKDQLDLFHLYGVGAVWDIYIPGLLYLIQFGIFHAYEYYSESRERERRAAQLREAALKSELAAIKAQLNPHFLYNVFNTISASVPAELEGTREMIAKLSDLFRYQLRASSVERVSLKEEIAFVKKYLDLEKARHEERLRIEIDIPPELMNEKVPPMILQPLVENSIKHGISSLIEGGEVYISAKKIGDKIQFEVSDTGVGVEDKTDLIGKGIGLTHTQLRLEKGYDSKLEFSDNEPRGLKIAFSL